MSDPSLSLFELSWHPEFGYRVSVPNLLREGERMAVVPVGAEVFVVVYDVGYDGLENVGPIFAREADAEAYIEAQGRGKFRYRIDEMEMH